MKEKIMTIDITEYPDSAYENMFTGFTQEQQIKIQQVLDDIMPINEDDWTN